MRIDTQLYTAVHALQQIEAGAKRRSTTTLAAIAEEALEQIEKERSQYDSRAEFERWIPCSERIADACDGDCDEMVWIYLLKDKHNCKVIRKHYSDADHGSHWKHTGLKRPEPPQGGRE